MAKGTKYSQQFKEDAVQYRLDHPELPLRKAAENLGISESALKNWMKAAKEHEGSVLRSHTYLHFTEAFIIFLVGSSAGFRETTIRTAFFVTHGGSFLKCFGVTSR